MGWNRHKLLWDGKGMGQINMSHGQPWLYESMSPLQKPHTVEPFVNENCWRAEHKQSCTLSKVS